MITQGRVSVNGHVATELGTRADLSRDHVTLDGKPLSLPSAPPIVVLLHKPRGYVTTTRDPEGRPTVMDLLDRETRRKHPHLHPVGRLDFDTSGVLLLTDDGDLTQLLTHPSHGIEKTYLARVPGPMPIETIRKLEQGIRLEDGVTAPCRARVKAATDANIQLELTLREGRNRQVRRMLEAVGHPVKALRRVKFGGFDLKGLLSGHSRELLPGEVALLRKHAEAPAKTPSRPAPVKPRFPIKPRAEAKPRSTAKSRLDAQSGPPKKPRSQSRRVESSGLAQRVEKAWRERE
jgi:23S rRNA pseudouridine2605 synthase